MISLFLLIFTVQGKITVQTFTSASTVCENFKRIKGPKAIYSAPSQIIGWSFNDPKPGVGFEINMKQIVQVQCKYIPEKKVITTEAAKIELVPVN